MLSETKLFTEVTSEESAIVSGGHYYGYGHGHGTVVDFDLNSYLFIVGAGVLFGQGGLTDDELQYAFEESISTHSF